MATSVHLKRRRDAELHPRPVALPSHELRSEHQLVATLEAGVYHLDDIVAAAETAGMAGRNNGNGRRKRGDVVYRHRVRSALDARRRRKGDARSLGDAYWVIDGAHPRPANAVFVFMGQLSDISLALGAAADMAKQIDEPVDLIFCDPPWQLGVGLNADAKADFDQYGRPRSDLVSGYEEVPYDSSYYDWCLEWIEPAAKLLRPGGRLAIATGPQQSAAVQLAGMQSGLRFTNSIVVPKINGVQPTKNRFATSHFRLTVLSSGSERHPAQVFNHLEEFGVAASGVAFPRDVWPPVAPEYSRNKLRYPNQLPSVFADQVVRTYTNPGDLVVDFFNGSGTVPRVCLFRGRRCFASDKNPNSLRFTMGTILDIVNSRLASPALFSEHCGFPSAESA